MFVTSRGEKNIYPIPRVEFCGVRDCVARYSGQYDFVASGTGAGANSSDDGMCPEMDPRLDNISALRVY